jgi:D-alanyl-D-alanine carboxypeptidase
MTFSTWNFCQRLSAFAAVTIIAVALPIKPSRAQTSPAPPSPAHSPVNKTGVDLRAEVNKIKLLGAPGVLAYVRNGDATTTAAVGVSDVVSQRRIAGNEVWRIASVTKLVTAIIIQKLELDGQIKLDDHLSTYLPKIVPLAERITIRQLLYHTSGVPDYLAGRRVPINVSATRLASNLLRHRPRAQLIKDANKHLRQFAPGRMHEYSNTNYLLL